MSLFIWFCCDMTALYFAIVSGPWTPWHWFVFFAFATVQTGLHAIYDRLPAK